MKDYNDLVKLVKQVERTGGLDTNIENVVEYQDMIGHSSIEQLHELANGDYRRAFYRIYDVAEGTLATLEFFGRECEKIQAIRDERDELECQVEEQKAEVERQKKEVQKGFECCEKMRQAWQEADQKARDAAAQLEAAKLEIMKLKARLYDMEHSAE